jgi:hypothetical protein
MTHDSFRPDQPGRRENFPRFLQSRWLLPNAPDDAWYDFTSSRLLRKDESDPRHQLGASKLPHSRECEACAKRIEAGCNCEPKLGVAAASRRAFR